MSDRTVAGFERQWRERRATLVAQHDDGALSTLEDAIADNADVECMAYCYGGSAKVDAYEVLANLAEEGWRLVRAEAFGRDASTGGRRGD